MRAVVQRVRAARVEVEGAVVGAVGPGLCAFVAAHRDDGAADVAFLAEKIATMRIFADTSGKMSHSVTDVGGGVLVVSQFTLYGDLRRGRRPSFDTAMAPEPARAACEALVAALSARGLTVASGRFAAHMRVLCDNDGPVTILLDSQKAF